MKCECGYITTNDEEKRLLKLWGCARIKIRNSGLSSFTELCFLDRNTGKYYPPGTNPNEYQEDQDALKDGYVKIKEQENERRKK